MITGPMLTAEMMRILKILQDGGSLIAEIQPPQGDIIEIHGPCIVKHSLVEEIFANTTSEERCSRVILKRMKINE